MLVRDVTSPAYSKHAARSRRAPRQRTLSLFFVSVSRAIECARRHETCCVGTGYNTILLFGGYTYTVLNNTDYNNCLVYSERYSQNLPCE